MCYTCLGYIHVGYMHVILHYALLHITDTVHTKTQDAALYLLQHVPVSVVVLLCTVYTVHVRNVLVMTVTCMCALPPQPQETTV